MTGPLHDDELPIDEPLVRSLLAASCPAYAGLPLRRLDASGSSNALFRLGDDLLVRLPRQPGGTSTIENEQRWLPYVAASLPVPVPEVLAVGGPGFGYPERWSVMRWLEGEVPTGPTRGEAPRSALARDLASAVTTLRGLPVPDQAATDPGLRWYRGEPVARMDASTRRGTSACAEPINHRLQRDGLPCLDLRLAAGEAGGDGPGNKFWCGVVRGDQINTVRWRPQNRTSHLGCGAESRLRAEDGMSATNQADVIPGEGEARGGSNSALSLSIA